ALDLEAREERDGQVVVELELLQIVRQDALHELARLVVHFLIVDQDFPDVVRQIIAQRSDDRIAFLVDQEGRGPRDDYLQDRFPEPEQIVEISAQLLGSAADARGADDAAHAVGRRELLERLPDDVAVLARDSAGDAARARVVRHQDEEPPGEADVGRERGALRPALLLVHLDDDLLAFLQNLADLNAFALLGLAEEVFGGDFLQRQEAVTLRAVVDEGRLEARLEARDAAFV